MKSTTSKKTRRLDRSISHSLKIIIHETISVSTFLLSFLTLLDLFRFRGSILSNLLEFVETILDRSKITLFEILDRMLRTQHTFESFHEICVENLCSLWILKLLTSQRRSVVVRDLVLSYGQINIISVVLHLYGISI